MRRVSAPSDLVAEIGAGASALVLDRVAHGDRRIEAVDISDAARGQLRALLGDDASAVRCVRADACSVDLEEPVRVWHDRATFHFLTDPADQAAYARRAAASVAPGGHLVMATFSEQGPKRCSGLPIAPSSAGSLAAAFVQGFELVDSFERDHETPWGAGQRFTHLVVRRT